MKKTLLVMLVAAVVLPAVSARASVLCSAAGATMSRAFCSLAPSAAMLPGQGASPSFAIGGNGWILPIARTNPLNFGATFPGRSSRGVGATEPVQVSAQAGRQLNGEGGGAISGGLGISMNGAPDGWFKGAIGDGGRFYWVPWNPNITADTVMNPNPSTLEQTPEPLTLALFGTGLLVITLLVRRRSAGAGGKT